MAERQRHTYEITVVREDWVKLVISPAYHEYLSDCGDDNAARRAKMADIRTWCAERRAQFIDDMKKSPAGTRKLMDMSVQELQPMVNDCVPWRFCRTNVVL